jgi:hypothetical protein
MDKHTNNLVFNLETLPVGWHFCGVWMNVNVPRQKTKANFHPPIFGAVCLASCVPHPTEKCDSLIRVYSVGPRVSSSRT